jgi:hypothetical protein
LLGVLLGLAIARWMPASRWWRSLIFGLGCFILALPGPAVNVLLAALFVDTSIPGLGQLYDRTLIPTVLAALFRIGPIAIVLISLGWSRWYLVHRDVLAMEGRVGWFGSSLRFLHANWGYVLLCGVWLFAVAFADFSSFSQLLPPSVTPISKRIFELLHYGVRYQEAGLCLFLAICGMVIGGIAMSRFASSTERS